MPKKDDSGMINPHNPEFLTKKPWYLGQGEESEEPTLQHQGIQQEKQTELSLSKAEELLQKQRSKPKDSTKFTKLQWVEGLKKNKLPYRIAQIIKVHKNNTYDLKYEDGSVETRVKIGKGRPRIRATGAGNRATSHGFAETYDSKRDSYHGYNRDEHNEKLVKKYEQKLAIRRQLREQKQQSEQNDDQSDSDFSKDSDEEDDEFVQKDSDAKVMTTRLARQGGVGGAQMKITARNLRIREDTAKYLRNLDPNSAYYDPKSRSMRDNPHPEAEETDFAGDNFARISGDAVNLAQQQLFAWEATNRGVKEVHPQANPSQAEFLQKQFDKSAKNLKEQKKQSVLDKYGGEEYLNDEDDAKLRFGVETTTETYSRDGTKSSGNQPVKRKAIPSKYEEDVYINGHTTVWGSYFHRGAFSWGYADDHSLLQQSYCTGENGRIANDEANLRTHGTGQAGSAALAQARSMLNKSTKQTQQKQPVSRSKLYGEADQTAQLDQEKVRKAVQELEKSDTKKAKKYNSNHEVEMTEEVMEAYRLTKQSSNDPMAKISSDKVLDYK